MFRFVLVRVGVVTLLSSSTNCINAFAQSGVQNEIDQLRQQLADQQKQIDELRLLLRDRSKLNETQSASVQPPAPKPAVAHEGLAAPPQNATATAEQSAPAPSGRSPLTLGVGPVTFTPTGFIDYSQVWRSKTVSSGLPTNFAAIPFNDTVEGNRRQTLSSAANSRMGAQINASLASLRILGVVETDFLGYQPGNIATTTNSYGLRLRLAFADLQVGKLEILGGQEWSMLTPGRHGISALPGGLMLTEDLDPNIQSGLGL